MTDEETEFIQDFMEVMRFIMTNVMKMTPVQVSFHMESAAKDLLQNLNVRERS